MVSVLSSELTNVVQSLNLIVCWYSFMHGCRPAVSIFYLVLRALDTVEDDMTIPLEKKVLLLKEFHTYLYQPEWKFTESQEKDRAVLEDFPAVSGLLKFHSCL